MKTIYKKLFSSLEYKVIYFMIILILFFALVLLYTSQQRYAEFSNYHISIAQTSTQKISHKINEMIIKKRRLVHSFYEDNIKLIELIIQNPQERDYYDTLNSKLERYFDDYFATNIINEHSKLIVDEFEGNIREVCLADVAKYIQNNEQSIRIHPNHNLYHYDILVDITIKDIKYVFFVSFKADDIASLLQVSQNEYHHLIIVNTRIKNLIAITALGSRDKLKNKQQIYLSKKQVAHILASNKIPGTQWEILDLYQHDIFNVYKKELYQEELIVFIIFLIFTLTMAATIISALRAKELLSKSLLQKNSTIVALNKELKNLAVRDALTGLFNRRYFDETSLLKYREAKRLGVVYNIAIIDIDFFKLYNDNYGHIKGDECLQRVATCICSNFKRSNEFSARYGGEEFVIVNIGDDKEVFHTRLTALLLFLLKEAIVHEVSPVSDYITLSIGHSSSKDSKLQSQQEHLQEADEKLYEAKDSGRNKVVY